MSEQTKKIFNKKSFKETLNLPKTDFSQRANAVKKEPEFLKRWKDEKLCERAVEKNQKDGTPFTLHDGPPFANGHMHMGHALNRTLKDVICKSKRMAGHHVISVPGWDCHGLPIELKVAKELGADKDSGKVDRVTFKKHCRQYAQGWIDIQREEIKRLGVVTDWDHPYITMSSEYEASILESFAIFVEKGYIERKGKTVPWCASCRTVLATAEIEHKDSKDPSCYILFKLGESLPPSLKLRGTGRANASGGEDFEVSLLVWTTTPWTIPLNRAVVLRPASEYVLLQGRDEKQAFIVGEKLADKVCEEIGIEKKVLATFSSEKLAGKKVHHPYIEDLEVPIILDEMVLLDDGTACVHSAPGCGPEDYFLGIKNGLEIFSPLSPDGKYTEEIKPKELAGMSVFDGQIWSIKKLHEVGRLLHKSSITHSYPHCWRCQSPLIFRATDQWFCTLEKNNLVQRAIDVANGLKFVPDWGKTRLTSSMSSRTEWCLSRQRQWGVPIPALLCNSCDHPYLEADFVRAVASYVKKRGIEFWDEVTLEELVEKKILSSSFSCAKCNNHDLKNFRKEMDIVDVWFESGVSHTAVKNQYPSLSIPADVYLEGSDQHRGWFQSSLLSSMIMYNKTCTKKFVTHAFVLDAQAEKMSKSKGNVTYPSQIIEKLSADILRLWLAGSDFENDITISDEALRNASEVYRKIRNTCRFMISNLYDFDIKKDGVSIADLPVFDQFALANLQGVVEKVRQSYDDYWFANVFQTLNRYCTNDLSSFYLDVVKDRLYTDQSDGHSRRSAQTVMYHILDSLTKIMAPILSFLAEEVSDFYQAGKPGSEKKESIHLQSFPETIDIWGAVKRKSFPQHKIAAQSGLVIDDPEGASLSVRMTGWSNLLERVRPELLKAIEAKREQGLVKHSLEARVEIYIDRSNEQGEAFGAFLSYLEQRGEVPAKRRASKFFKDFIVVSQCEFVSTFDGLEQSGLDWLFVSVNHARGTKCPRCWQWEETDHEDGLCARCEMVVNPR
ncbi:isoleucine--tRNA ligase [Candidatus Babeliales bacterium]|nr:isoleucine--tRNA ligase [Candidatus Babeliales bacterium]